MSRAIANKATPEMLASMAEFATLLRCPICSETMRSPALLSSCTHSFCKECIESHVADNDVCPVDGCNIPCIAAAANTIQTNGFYPALTERYETIRGALESLPDFWFLPKSIGTANNVHPSINRGDDSSSSRGGATGERRHSTPICDEELRRGSDVNRTGRTGTLGAAAGIDTETETEEDTHCPTPVATDSMDIILPVAVETPPTVQKLSVSNEWPSDEVQVDSSSDPNPSSSGSLGPTAKGPVDVSLAPHDEVLPGLLNGQSPPHVHSCKDAETEMQETETYESTASFLEHGKDNPAMKGQSLNGPTNNAAAVSSTSVTSANLGDSSSGEPCSNDHHCHKHVASPTKGTDDGNRRRFVCFSLESSDVAEGVNACKRRHLFDEDEIFLIDCHGGRGKTRGGSSAAAALSIDDSPWQSSNSSTAPTLRIDKENAAGRALFGMTHSICGSRPEFRTCDGSYVDNTFGFLASAAAGVPIIDSSWLIDAAKAKSLPALPYEYEGDASLSRRSCRQANQSKGEVYKVLGCCGSELGKGYTRGHLLNGYTCLLHGDFHHLQEKQPRQAKRRKTAVSRSDRNSADSSICFSKERIVALLELSSAKVFDLSEIATLMDVSGDDVDQRIASALGDIDNNKLVVVVKKDAEIKEFRSASELTSQTFGSTVPVVMCNWVLDSIRDYEVKDLCQYKVGLGKRRTTN